MVMKSFTKIALFFTTRKYIPSKCHSPLYHAKRVSEFHFISLHFLFVKKCKNSSPIKEVPIREGTYPGPLAWRSRVAISCLRCLYLPNATTWYPLVAEWAACDSVPTMARKHGSNHPSSTQQSRALTTRPLAHQMKN